MNWQTIMTMIIDILFGAVVDTATNLGEGVIALVENLFFTGTGESQTLNVFAIIVLIFGGITLSLGLGRKMLNWLSGLGSGRL